jgi:hypothetical protein
VQANESTLRLAPIATPLAESLGQAAEGRLWLMSNLSDMGSADAPTKRFIPGFGFSKNQARTSQFRLWYGIGTIRFYGEATSGEQGKPSPCYKKNISQDISGWVFL